MKRPTEDEYFMKHAELVATRSKCLSRNVGAILVKEGRIISMGYNGTPTHYRDCTHGGCERCKEVFKSKKSGENLDRCVCVHAEVNTIVFAARNGINISGAVLYTTSSPCLECAKALVNAKIYKVVYKSLYSSSALLLLEKCGIKLIHIENGKSNRPTEKKS